VVLDEVVANLDVLGLVVLNRIMSNFDGTLIVTQEWHLVTMNTIILHGLPHPKELSTTARGHHILGFGGGERHTILLLEEQLTKDLSRN
jgi:pseudouridine-5'-phosphate glycosidase